MTRIVPPPSHDATASASSISIDLFLSPWFTKKTLDQTASGKDTIADLVMYRNGAAALFNDKNQTKTVVRFEPAPQIDQRFRLADPCCGACRSQKIGDYCRHVAAIARHLLFFESGGHVPAPILFQASPLAVIGRYLHSCHEKVRSPRLEISQGEDRKQEARFFDDRNRTILAATMPEKDMEELAALASFFRMSGCESEPREKAAAMETLFGLASEMCRSETERELNRMGRKSMGQKQDGSLWLWLAGKFFLRCPHPRFSLARREEDGIFILKGHKRDEILISVALQRERTVELLGKIPESGLATMAPSARAFTKVSLDEENGALSLEPCLRLDGGSWTKRERMEEHRYGTYYFREGKVFFQVEEQRHHFGLVRAPEMATRIEDLAGPRLKNNGMTIIPSEDVPNFIRDHEEALRSDENEVDEALLHFTIQDIPDRLKVHLLAVDGDWCYLSGHYGMGNMEIELSELMAARRKGCAALPGKRKWLRLKDSPLSWLYDLGEERSWRDEKGGLGVKLTRRELLSLAALMPEIDYKACKGIPEKTAGKLLFPETWQNPAELPFIPGHLREYQVHGLAWLHQLYQYGLGGILADDMGLGKTHQMLGLLSIIRRGGGEGGRFLVLCPTTVAPHWLDKIRRFYPELSGHIYHGTNRDIAEARRHDVIITTYGVLRRDAEMLALSEFDVIAFDEMQNLKNKNIDAYKAARRLNARMLIGLTGTPLENSIHDLKALFDLCLPGLLGGEEAFRKQYVFPIEEKGCEDAKDHLVRRISPFLLRRKRRQVLAELPEIIEDMRTCELTDDQVCLYREIIEDRGRGILGMLVEDTRAEIPYMEIITIINYLKQICDHPSLLKGSGDPEAYRSGKWELFLEILGECLESNLKVVVFSQYVSMLDLIECHLEKTGIPFGRLRGDMSMKQREEMIERFNHDQDMKVFTASLLAGGTGVDLTGAQAVIHYDRWWNAAREDQATARVHRMGQKHVVQVFKVVTIGTLEEKIHHIIEKRRNLASDLVREDDAGFFKRLDREDLISLLQLG